MKLQVNDLVHIKWGRSEYVEKVEEHRENYFRTSNFFIHDDFTASYQHNKPYMFYFSIEKVWRLDEHDNYIRIYPEPEKEEPAETEIKKDVEENKKPFLSTVGTPTGVSWDEHNKVLQENAELREAVVDQAKEINKLKKESNHD